VKLKQYCSLRVTHLIGGIADQIERAISLRENISYFEEQ
jgi:hypothetical protein